MLFRLCTAAAAALTFASLAAANVCPNNEVLLENYGSPDTMSIDDAVPPATATNLWSSNTGSTWGTSLKAPSAAASTINSFTLYFTRVPDGLQCKALIAEYDCVNNKLAGAPIWTSEVLTINGYTGPYGFTYPFTVPIPGGLQLDPTKVYAALLSNIEPNRAAWPAFGGLTGGIVQEMWENALPPIAGCRAALCSYVNSYAGLQINNSFNNCYVANSMAFWADFTPPAPFDVAAKKNKYARELKQSVAARAGRTVKITYTVTNPTSTYQSGYNFVVRTTDCVSLWSWPVALEAGKSAHFTLSLKLDKCSDATTIGLESAFDTTSTYGPALEVMVKPLTKKPALCADRVD